MATVVVSSKGQIVIPSELRRRLGMGAGAKVEVVEDRGGVRLVVNQAVREVNLSSVVGMVKAPKRASRGRLADFDAASTLRRKR